MYLVYGMEGASRGGPVGHWLDMLHPDDAIPVRALMARALSGAGDFDAEYRVLWPDGAVRHLKGEAMVFRDAEGHAVRMVGVSYDITEHKVAEQKMVCHHIHTVSLGDAVQVYGHGWLFLFQVVSF